MSGFVALVDLDSAPVAPPLLRAMTGALVCRGPDALETWTSGHVGFGHTLLRTTPESAHERQPLTLDGQIVITADCRVDARQELKSKLAAHDNAPSADAPDAELILRAYSLWGDACVDHLLGDFSFAIWDARRRTLFCARDHFGVKPLFYAHVGRTLIVSNDLTCVRCHPAVPDTLDDLAIADFLVYSYALDLDRTSFSAIRRVPPGHTLTARGDAVDVRRYWDVPLEEEIRYRRRGDYVDHFLEVFDAAVRDRIRTNAVGVMMSGGLDSPAVAAAARRALEAAGQPFDLRAHTIVFDRILPDEERKYSKIVADGIGIPIQHYPFDDYGFPPPESEREGYPPEPCFLFDRTRTLAVHRGPTSATRVLLRGEGADPLLDLGSTVDRLFVERRYGRLAREFLWLAWTRGQAPRMGLRSLVLGKAGERLLQAAPDFSAYPDWIDPSLERRLDLRARWLELGTPKYVRPGFELKRAFWPLHFEAADPGRMGLAAEARYPFVDVRVASFLLRVPPLPWAVEKSLLRVAMKGRLPEETLRRPKTPFVGNPWAALLPPASTAWWEPYFVPAPELDRFVNVRVAKSTFPQALQWAQAHTERNDDDALARNLQPISLNLWLRQIAYAKLDTDRSVPEEVKR